VTSLLVFSVLTKCSIAARYMTILENEKEAKKLFREVRQALWCADSVLSAVIGEV